MESSTPNDLVGLLLSINDIDTLQTNTHLLTSLNNLTVEQLADTNPNDPLTVLNPRLHSLGYFYFVTARCNLCTQQNAFELYNILWQFIQHADWNQVKLAGAQMTRIVTALDRLAQVQNNSILPLSPLSTIISQLDTLTATNTPSSHSIFGCALTVFHSALAKLCLLTKMYKYPLPILDKDIVQVYGTTIEHYLEYHYYGAIIYIGNKEYEKAMDFLTLVIAAPVHKAVSAIQLEAYKRYILVSLIAFGQVCPLPKYVTPTIEKTCKKQNAAYFSLIDAFDHRDIGKLISVLQKHRQTFNSDGLVGLTNQLVQASYRKKIMTLTTIYYKVKLDDLSHQISPSSSSPLTKDQLEHLLVDMIGKDHIKATISIVLIDGSPVKMVQFNEESSPTSPSSRSTHRLELAMAQVAHINDQLSRMDKTEGLNKDFQSKYMVLSANGGAPSAVSTIDEDMDVPLDE
ncbi:hypothetical protein [Absidia glauca]|uniref:COP9 signalosome complex subunit 3 n=1 Tax=Absidia glauca TaxID=4829 RepID=A0A168S954_ABSGL|nr:hypothetical protein [Absidia glauca]